MNSGVSPLDLEKNQVAFSFNASVRDGYLHQRPPFQNLALNFQGNDSLQALVLTGLFQGGGYYRPDYGTESLIAQISGHLIKFTEGVGSWTVTDISIPGDLNDASVKQVWMWQSEKWMIVNDGSGELPIFFDGTTSRRSFGAAIQVGTTSTPFTPPAIGATAQMTLSLPYTGALNVPIIFDGEFYEAYAVGTSGVTTITSYSASLTNLTDTPGATIPVGTNVSIIPANLALLDNQTILAGPVSKGTPTLFSVPKATADLTGKTVLIAPTSGNAIQFKFTTVSIQTGTSTYYNAVIQSSTSQPKTFAVGTVVVDSNNSSPTVIIGTIATAYLVPPANTTTTVLLSALYSGASNQQVWIGNKQYAITPIVQPPPPVPSNLLTVVNLTDPRTTSVPAGAILTSVPELPAGRMGAYGMARNAMCLTNGLSYIMGDLVGGASGTQANGFRDAVLKTTENDDLPGGGAFGLPGSGDIITAMIYPPNLDTSLGQGALQIFTPFSCFSNNTSVDRTTWESPTTPLQTESLKDNGALGQNSTICVNSDTFFRNFNGDGSLVLARRDFGGWGNKTISNEMSRVYDLDNQTLLPYGSQVNFDNRKLETCNPQTGGSGIYHRGITSLNFDLLSSLRTSVPPAWESVWMGLNALQIVAGRVSGTLRSFAFTANLKTGNLELYELIRENTAQYLDNAETPIVWGFETGAMFNKDVKPLTDLAKLVGAKMWLKDIRGNVNVKIYYRPDFYPCWTLWRDLDFCVSNPDATAKPGYRMPINLGQPSPLPDEIGNNRPLMIGYFFQFRVVVTGAATFTGLLPRAVAEPESDRIEMDETPCQIIDCDAVDDFSVYSLQT